MGKQIEACHIAVGARIRMIRETLGLTQNEIALQSKISRPSIANIEAGKQRLLLNDIERLATAIGTRPKHLMKGIWW